MPGGTTGRSATGTETLAVVPQLTMGHPGRRGRTEHLTGPVGRLRSPPGRATGRWVAAAASGRSEPTTWSGGTTGGSLAAAGPAKPSTSVPPMS